MSSIMRHAKIYALALCLLTLFFNNCSGFSPLQQLGDYAAESYQSTASEGLLQGVDPHPLTPAPLGTPTPKNPFTVSPVAVMPIPDPQADKIVSNFNVNDWVSTDSISNDAKSPYFFPDTVGAFRFLCKPSHNLYDDPIVFPGKPGASHMHTFFGNTETTGNSTYESLRSSGNGTCAGGPLNRSAYWMPAMRLDDGDGNDLNDKVVMPDYTVIYYKTDPEYARVMARGLRMIFGYNMSDPSKSSGFKWLCLGTSNQDGSVRSPGLPGEFQNLSDMATAGCPAYSQVEARLSGPTCWDGRLDSTDHRSHMAFPQDTHLGYAACPSDHPYGFPEFTLAAVWSVGADGPAEVTKMYLSSDHMPGMQMVAGSTFHTDWFGAWDDDVLAAWMMHSDGDFRNNSSGIIGDGRGLKDPYSLPNPNGYTSLLNAANPRIVDPPVHP